MKSMLLRASFLGVALVLVINCGGSGSSGGTGLPEWAYGYGSDPLPEFATLTDATDGMAGLESGAYIQATPPDPEAEERAAAALEAEDDQTIAQYLLANPEVGPLVPPEPAATDAAILERSPGHYLRRLVLPGGQELVTTLMGRRWIKRTIGDNLRSLQSRSDQLGVYSLLYEHLTPSLRDRIALQDPAVLAADTSRASAFFVSEQVRLLRSMPMIMASIAPPPAGTPAPPGAEQGAGLGTDAEEVNPCTHLNTGLWQHWDWSSKYLQSPVKMQGQRGTCTSFATCSCLEYLAAKQCGARVNLSEQSLHNRYKLAWYPDHLFEGVVAARLVSRIASAAYNVPFESAWNYNPSARRTTEYWARGEFDETVILRYRNSCLDYDEPCSNTAHQGAMWCWHEGAYWRCGYAVPALSQPGQGMTIPDTAWTSSWNFKDKDVAVPLVQFGLLTGAAVILSVNIRGTMENPFSVNGQNTGFADYDANDPINRGGHSVHVVGYVSNQQVTDAGFFYQGAGGGYFIVKNSWGTCYGDGGYVYVPYAYVRDNGMGACLIYLAAGCTPP